MSDDAAVKTNIVGTKTRRQRCLIQDFLVELRKLQPDFSAGLVPKKGTKPEKAFMFFVLSSMEESFCANTASGSRTKSRSLVFINSQIELPIYIALVNESRVASCTNWKTLVQEWLSALVYLCFKNKRPANAKKKISAGSC